MHYQIVSKVFALNKYEYVLEISKAYLFNYIKYICFRDLYCRLSISFKILQ